MLAVDSSKPTNGAQRTAVAIHTWSGVRTQGPTYKQSEKIQTTQLLDFGPALHFLNPNEALNG
jgi:hypothetical protein